MPAAAGAVHLGARIAGFPIGRGCQRAGQRLPETGPAGLAVILGVGSEQRQAIGGADEGALAVLLEQRRGEGHLGALLAQDVILLGGQPLFPFGIAEADRIGFRVGGAAAGGQHRKCRAGDQPAHGLAPLHQNRSIVVSSLRKPWTKLARTRCCSPVTCTRMRRLCISSSRILSCSSASRAPTQRWMP